VITERLWTTNDAPPTLTYVVQCDAHVPGGCPHQSAAQLTPTRASREAEAAGWTYTYLFGWLCPQHTAEQLSLTYSADKGKLDPYPDPPTANEPPHLYHP